MSPQEHSAPAARRPASAMSRRSMLAGAAGLTAAATGLVEGRATAATEKSAADFKIANGRIKQSVIQWCFKPMPVETLAAGAAQLGLKSVEIVQPADWPILKK